MTDKEKELAKDIEEFCGGDQYYETCMALTFQLCDLFEVDIDTAEKICQEYCEAQNDRRLSTGFIGLIKYGMAHKND